MGDVINLRAGMQPVPPQHPLSMLRAMRGGNGTLGYMDGPDGLSLPVLMFNVECYSGDVGKDGHAGMSVRLVIDARAMPGIGKRAWFETRAIPLTLDVETGEVLTAAWPYMDWAEPVHREAPNWTSVPSDRGGWRGGNGYRSKAANAVSSSFRQWLLTPAARPLLAAEVQRTVTYKEERVLSFRQTVAEAQAKVADPPPHMTDHDRRWASDRLANAEGGLARHMGTIALLRRVEAWCVANGPAADPVAAARAAEAAAAAAQAFQQGLVEAERRRLEAEEAAARAKAQAEAAKAARARLEGAAPALLEAAEAALACIERHVPPTEFAPRDRLRAAIKLAKGEG